MLTQECDDTCQCAGKDVIKYMHMYGEDVIMYMRACGSGCDRVYACVWVRM